LLRFRGPDNVLPLLRTDIVTDPDRQALTAIGQIGIGIMDPVHVVELSAPGYEKVLRAEEPTRGWCATIAVHDTTLGPALGGLRMWKYASKAEALTDVLRLARGMTYKSAVARTGLGGGKAVVIGDSQKDKSDELFFWLGRFVDTLKGRYITAEDVGTSVLDLDLVARETKWVTGRAREVGGSGDPSPFTALGAFISVQTSLKEVFGSPEVKGKRIAIQGLGHVGYWLAKNLSEAGAKLFVTDLHPQRVERVVKEFGAKAVEQETVHATDCDVYSPCALGAVLNDKTIPEIRAKIVCGAANNQLLEERHGEALMQRGILYAPDYVVNAGGILNISVELSPKGYDEKIAEERVRGIGRSLADVFAHAKSRAIPTARAADEVAQAILAEGKRPGRAR
jgi:leucine dehydrogenase